MKRIVVSILGLLFFRWAYPKFNFREYPIRKLIKCFIAQKVFCINRKVPWPVHWTSEIKAHENIERGTETPGSMMGCYIDGRNGIVLGNNVWIGPKVSIISMDHCLTDYTKYKTEAPIRIGNNSLLTTNSVILPGVELGPHTVVAAGAVVTKSFPEGNQILAGNPAMVIKKLEPYEIPTL
jgi:acetyltransferase-like isoleucine patch superfamily enzyme